MTHPDQSFRRDVQGLRGLAVLAVVLYHANLSLPGGFLGVDVFFVISGYVVTLQIMRQVGQSGRFSLADFYARRIRRLLPIYLLVASVTIPLTFIFLSPFGEQQEAFSTARWSAFFVSNYQLMLDDSYQNLVANPFRHLWSLSVEEQFYLVLPPLFAGLLFVRRRFGSRHRSFDLMPQIVLVVLSIASLAHALSITQIGGSLDAQRWAFFSMPARFWELGVGVVLALIPRARLTRSNILNEASVIVGLAVLLCCFFLVEDVVGHPGPAAILVVVATALLILAGDRSRVFGALLRIRPMTYMGDVSYGWYLWHWPFIVFTAVVYPDTPIALAIAAALSLAVAALTYRLVENPIRRQEGLRGWRAAALLSGSVLVIYSLSFLGDRLADTGLGLGQVEQVEFDFTKEFELDQRGGNMSGACFLRTLPAKISEPPFGDVQKISEGCSNEVDRVRTDVLLLGDSTALAVSDGVFEAGRLAGSKVVAFTAAGCPTLKDAPVYTFEGCLAVQDTYQTLVDELDPRLVILVNRFDLYVGPALESGENDHRIRIEGRSPSPQPVENLSNVVSSLRRFVMDMSRRDARVVVMLQPPPGVLLDRTLFEKWFPRFAQLGESRLQEVVNQREQIRLAVLQEFAESPDVVVYEPSERVCGRVDFCPVEPGDGSFYANSTHLNPLGSARLTEDFVEFIVSSTR